MQDRRTNHNIISLTDLSYEYRDVLMWIILQRTSYQIFHIKSHWKMEPRFGKNFKVRADVNLELEKHILKLLEQGVIERTSSPYNSPVLCVAKPDSKETRFLLDCRAINERIVTNYNYIHDAEHVIQRILQCKILFKIWFEISIFFIELGSWDITRQRFREKNSNS